MIYVDYIVTHPARRVRGLKHSKWCHMWADSLDELHSFAVKIGLQHHWFQGNHYDLTPKKRALAIRCGATESSIRDYLRSKGMARL